MKIRKEKYHQWMFGFLLIFFVQWFFQGHFLVQLNNPVLKITSIDNTYWLFCILRIPQFVIKNAFAFDALLMLFLFVSFITNKKWCFRILLLIVIVHVVSFNVYSGIHSKSCVILPLVLLPFCFPKHQLLLKDGVRYYLLFVFVSAAIFKITNGGLFHADQFVHILENQHVDLSILNPTSLTYQISLWLIDHPIIATILWLLFFACELVFIIGFFTKKHDLFLAFVLILIIVHTYILMRISLFDFMLFLPLLVNNDIYPTKSNT